MNKNLLIGIVAFGGLLLVAALLADNPTEPNQVTTEEAQVVVLPKGVPSNIPLYPGAVLQTVRESSGDSSEDFSLSLDVEASIQEVNAWYREAMNSNGWKIKSDKNVAGYQIIQTENGNLYTSMQTANGQIPGHVAISQSVKVRK